MSIKKRLLIVLGIVLGKMTIRSSFFLFTYGIRLKFSLAVVNYKFMFLTSTYLVVNQI
jgi:hypothetical protein